MEHFNNLRRLRDARKLTQADVAEELGINQAEYSRMEKGRRRIGTHLEKLSQILQADEDSILTPSHFAGSAQVPSSIPLYALPEIDGESIRFDLSMTSQLAKPSCHSGGAGMFAILNPGNVMAPRIKHGDFLYADPDESVRDDDLCVLTLMRGNREVAIVRQACGGGVWLRLDENTEETYGKELKSFAPVVAIKLAR